MMKPKVLNINKPYTFLYEEKQIFKAKNMILSICEKHYLKQIVINEAVSLYQQIYKQNLIKGKSNLAVIYSCIYMACLINTTPKTALELTAYTEITEKRLLKTVGKFYC